MISKSPVKVTFALILLLTVACVTSSYGSGEGSAAQQADDKLETTKPAEKPSLTSFTTPQIYTGTLSFPRSKNVKISFTLSADAKRITEVKFTADDLFLPAKKAGAGDGKANASGKSVYEYGKDSSQRVNYAITKSGGYNVLAMDKSGNPVVSSINFKGGFVSTEPIEVVNGTISSEYPLYFNLTVSDTSIDGDVKISMRGCATSSAKLIAKNTTMERENPAEKSKE